MKTVKRIVIFGAGDLAVRIANHLQRINIPLEIVLASRQTNVAAQANLINSVYSHDAEKNFFATQLDLLDKRSLKTFLQTNPADLLINCASLISPWAYHNNPNKLGRALNSLGFASQICSQLPPILALMENAHEMGLSTPIINCSFPDATHPILEKLKLAPLCGVGNSGMLYRTLHKYYPKTEIKLIAHHALTQKLLCETETIQYCDYYLELDQKPHRWPELMQNITPMQRSVELNSLTAAHAVDIIEALLNRGITLHTSIPGPFGLPGGYPCVIQSQQLSIALPAHMRLSEAQSLNNKAAQLDGIANIDDSGIVYYTDEMQSMLPKPLKFLGQALHPKQALDRFYRLNEVLSHQAFEYTA